MAEANKNTIDANSFKIDNSKLVSFPVDTLLPSDFSAPNGYTIVNIIYEKPVGEQRSVMITVVTRNEAGELKNFDKIIEFAYSENDKVASSISPFNFFMNPKIQNGAPPDELRPTDFKYKKSGVTILDVEYKTPPDYVTETTANLVIKINSLNAVNKITVNIGFAKTRDQAILESVRNSDFKIKTSQDKAGTLVLESVEYLGNTKLEIIQSKISSNIDTNKTFASLEVRVGRKVGWITIPIKIAVPKVVAKLNHLLSLVKIKPEFMKKYPPAYLGLENIIFPKKLKLISLLYNPPKSITNRKGSVDMLFQYRKKLGRITLPLQFESTVKEYAEYLQKNYTGKELTYIRQGEQVYPPNNLYPSDFVYEDENVHVIKVDYDFKKLDQKLRDFSVKVHTLFKGVKIAFDKEVSFKQSIAEHIIQRNKAKDIDVDLIQLPKEFMNPAFIYDHYSNKKKFNPRVIKKVRVMDPYNFDITEIKIDSFDIYSREAKYIIFTTELVDGKYIENEVSKDITFTESYAESLLMDWTGKDIEINPDVMEEFPPDEISPALFLPNELFKIVSVSYVRPPIEERKTKVAITLRSGNKKNTITKELVFLYSRQEHQDMLWSEVDKKTIDDFDPKAINLHINILGEPIEEINEANISGIPKGIEFTTAYSPPPFGSAVAELKIIISRNSWSKVFKQKLIFALPRTHKGAQLQRTHTVALKVPKVPVDKKINKPLVKKTKKIELTQSE